MDLPTDQPLDLPLPTLAAVERARTAVRRTRQNLELAFIPILAGSALGLVGLGSFALLGKATMPAWVEWPLVGLALMSAWSGVALMWWFDWTLFRSGRLGGTQSPLGVCGARSRSRVIGLLAILLLSQLVSSLAFQALKGRISEDLYYGIMIWTWRSFILLVIAFFVYRFVRSGFWQHLVLAAGITGTLGLHMFFNPGRLGTVPTVAAAIVTLALLATILAATSLVVRWRRWTRANRAAAADAAQSTEVA